MNYETIDTIEKKHSDSGSYFSFEYSDIEVSIIKDDKGMRYLRIYKKECAAEANGRPITNIRDACYPLTDADNVTQQNWKKIMFRHFDEEIILGYESYCGV